MSDHDEKFYSAKDYSEDEIYQIIQEILRGNTERFEILYHIYYKMVISIIRRIVKPPTSEIDGIVNEAFLVIYRGLKGFKGTSKFSTYTYRIVLNFAFKIAKKRSKDRKMIVHYGDDNNEQIANIASPTRTEDLIIDQQVLQNAISHLNHDLQEALDLYYYEQYSIREIADIVGTTETAIKNRLYQARNKIKIDLKGGDSNE